LVHAKRFLLSTVTLFTIFVDDGPLVSLPFTAARRTVPLVVIVVIVVIAIVVVSRRSRVPPSSTRARSRSHVFTASE
jgi:hypothetical protein